MNPKNRNVKTVGPTPRQENGTLRDGWPSGRGGRAVMRGVCGGVLMMLAVGLCGAGQSPSAGGGVDSDPVLQELQQHLSEAASVYLEFVQERRLALFDQPLTSEGVLLLGQPDLIRWETTSPYESILLRDRDSVAQFERTDGSWEKIHLGFPEMLKQVMQQMMLMHQGRFDALTNEFSLTVRSGDLTTVTLVPRESGLRSMLASLDMVLEPGLTGIREVVMHEPGGDATRIRFGHERRGVTIPAAAFDQVKPMDLDLLRKALDGGS